MMMVVAVHRVVIAVHQVVMAVHQTMEVKTIMVLTKMTVAAVVHPVIVAVVMMMKKYLETQQLLRILIKKMIRVKALAPLHLKMMNLGKIKEIVVVLMMIQAVVPMKLMEKIMIMQPIIKTSKPTLIKNLKALLMLKKIRKILIVGKLVII